MRKSKTLFSLLMPAVCMAASFTASQNGNWNASATWGGAGVPGLGDTAAISQYVVTIPTSTTTIVGTVNTTSLMIGDGAHAAGLTVEGTLILRGRATLNGPTYDCAHSPSVTLGTGSTLELDENGGANPSGFVISPSTAPCARFTIGSSGDVCTWGTSSPTCPTNITSINNGSANGVLLLDSGTGYGDSVTTWNGVAVSSCGSSSVPCYQSELYQAGSSWLWQQIYLNGDSYFGTNIVNSNATPISLDSVISASRLTHTDIFFGSLCSNGSYTPVFTAACTAPKSVTNSLIRDMSYTGTGNDSFTAGATVKNVYWDGLGSNYGSLTAANIAGGSWSYSVLAEDADACAESGINLSPSILAPSIDHVYQLCSATNSVPVLIGIPASSAWGTTINLSNVIFDNESGTAGHCLIPYGSTQGGGYAMNLSYATVLPMIGGSAGCGFDLWSSTCPAAPITSITHVLQPGTGIPSEGTFYACEGLAVASSVPLLSNFKGNIYYDSSARGNPLTFGDYVAGSQPANVASPTGVDYNVNYNFVPFVTTPYTTACATGCTNSGSPYALPMTGASPGGHDQNINPQLRDNTRTAYTWAALRGQASSAAGFRQVFINDGPARIGSNIAALFYYINQGNIPTRSLWNAMPDGTTIGPSQPVMFPRGIRTVTQ